MQVLVLASTPASLVLCLRRRPGGEAPPATGPQGPLYRPLQAPTGPGRPLQAGYRSPIWPIEAQQCTMAGWSDGTVAAAPGGGPRQYLHLPSCCCCCPAAALLTIQLHHNTGGWRGRSRGAGAPPRCQWWGPHSGTHPLPLTTWRAQQ